ncbi:MULTISPECIES: POTRA domain-containing protein [Myroides]|uniref:BamA/TamA family outer membrane protein n=1 Tax=Myroides albus TaxID=2562892 RepID=A0A6I3LGX4_9FLAO|nr:MULTISPECIES: BamA/TamA family outer membrane protein [Myroides]MTG97087.1 BamA/TamA family outer membrane protein [Myroides albus]MVX36824.1 BamA/TamA family outer membrane protein [Myroides sp. LoEW2-1]UVD78490.1 BamA/TamA family outer membrane protein [Myroides albus]
MNTTLSKFLPKIALIILTSISFFACSTTKRVPRDRALLVDNTIIENTKKSSKEEIYQQLYQTPNSTFPFTGFRLRLHLYNLAKPNADSLYQVWLQEHPNTEKKLTAVLSKKQVNRLGESFIIAGINNFLIKTGEVPALYDTLKTNKSVERLKNYYFNRGYFDTKVESKIDTVGEKKVKATYTVTTGEPYYIDSIKTSITTKELESLYVESKNKSLIKPNTVFNVKNFDEERKRITNDFRNQGAYHFQELNIRYEVDTILDKKNTANINLIIDPQTVKSGDTLVERPFKLYKISEVNLFTDNSSKDKKYDLDSLQYNNFNIYSSAKLQYKPKALTDAIFITKGSTFSDQKRILTSRSISNLRIFNYPVIEYIEDQRDTTGQSLISNIYLTSRKKMTFNPSLDVTHSNIQDFGIGGSVGVLFRNVFKRAEILEVGLKGSIGSSRQMNNPNNVFFNVTEYGGDVKLTFPRVFFPIKTDRIIPKSMLPTTTMSFGISKQRNIGLDKDNFTGTINYKWLPSHHNSFSLDLLNAQYVKNTNPNNYFSVYSSSYSRLNAIAQDYKIDATKTYYDESGDLTIGDSGANYFIWDALDPNNPLGVSEEDKKVIRSIEERRVRLSENNLIIASNLVFTKTTRTSINDNNFYTLRTKVESAGALMNLIMKNASTKEGPTGKKTIMDVEFSQYIKTEIDFVKYWDLGKQRVFAIKAFGGLAVPYGNSNSIPFTRSYYSGGSNDNRGWQSYRLGPGKSGGINDFNEANMKLFFSSEYRFNIGGKWYGALFIDASNIWNVFDDVEDENYTFNGISSLRDFAVASGFGIRYDFSFFVFRLDMGFKTFNPTIDSNRKWFKEFNFRESVLNVGINYPF